MGPPVPGGNPVLVYLRLAEDSYRDFVSQCRTKKDSDETAAEVRARELEEARALLEEVDALLAPLPSQLGIHLADLETDVTALDQAIDQKEADLIPFLEDPAVRCDPPGDAAAAFRARVEGVRAEMETIALHREQAGQYRTQACDSLDRPLVEESTRLARHAAEQAGAASLP